MKPSRRPPAGSRARRAGVLAAVLAGALTLPACGSDAGAQVGADEEQTLTVWAMGEEGQRLTEFTDAYAAERDHLSIEVTPVSWENAHQKLVSAAAAGELPDVMQMGTSYMGEFVELGVLEPVDTSVFAEDDFFPAAWDTGVVDEQAYGVPWYVDTRVLYYRTDLAEQAGVDEPPATWQDMRELATALQDNGSRWGVSLQPGGTGAWQTLAPFVFSAGGQFTDAEGNPTMDTPEMVRALTEYQAYFEEGLASDRSQIGYDVIPDFGEGVAPMFVSGPWMVANIRDQLPDLGADAWDVALLPADESSISFIGGSNLVISADSEHKAAAQELIAHFAEPEQQRAWYEAVGGLPAVEAAWEGGELADSPELQVMEEQLATAAAVPVIPEWEELADAISTAMEGVTTGNTSPEEAAESLQSEAEGIVR
ncbi:sugar ABC transporter substrate-binding protein [Streptomyces sp. B6B3]|uniref:sugar ABC transporter substrate-binding protein n=1 Tax=Streptomyces sp. B6B3 TaxID=3153570 RepID=UPI00325D38A0